MSWPVIAILMPRDMSHGAGATTQVRVLKIHTGTKTSKE